MGRGRGEAKGGAWDCAGRLRRGSLTLLPLLHVSDAERLEEPAGEVAGLEDDTRCVGVHAPKATVPQARVEDCTHTAGGRERLKY